jgi:hypothetical protein
MVSNSGRFIEAPRKPVFAPVGYLLKSAQSRNIVANYLGLARAAVDNHPNTVLQFT